jgi:hypothetical protein
MFAHHLHASTGVEIAIVACVAIGLSLAMFIASLMPEDQENN